ncbi:MAG TPA: HAD family hydrolase [Acidimicrobiales bacterium]|nr:HAD family hydrolase [Acidimicrobiales bacterium]
MELRPGVLFDVDGTLVDSNYLHTIAWSRALRDAGEWAPMNAIHRLVGMGGDQLVPELLGHPNDKAKEGRAEHYRQLIGEVRVFPGASGLIRRCHEAGLAVVLASSSPADELEELRGLLDVDDCLDAATNADDAEHSKPAPDIFLAAMESGGVDPARALVVGDSIWDIQAARSAGVGCIAVETGGFSQHELSEEGARHVYRDVEELLAQFLTSPLAWLLG